MRNDNLLESARPFAFAILAFIVAFIIFNALPNQVQLTAAPAPAAITNPTPQVVFVPLPAPTAAPVPTAAPIPSVTPIPTPAAPTAAPNPIRFAVAPAPSPTIIRVPVPVFITPAPTPFPSIPLSPVPDCDPPHPHQACPKKDHGKPEK